MHGMHHMMNPMMSMNPMMNPMMMGGMGGMHHGMHGMHGMHHHMMNPMMMGGMGGMGGMGQQSTPEIEIKTSKNAKKHMEKTKKKKHHESDSMDSSHRRRLVRDDFDQFIVQKCINNDNVWMCLEYNYYDHTIFADYIVVNDDAAINIFGFDHDKYTESEQWTVSDSNDEQCNDNLIKFVDFYAICIDKQQQVLIKYSDDNMDDLKINLLNKMHWNEIYEMNNNQKKLCKNILSNRLCALFTFDDTTNQIQNIDAISVQSVIR